MAPDIVLWISSAKSNPLNVSCSIINADQSSLVDMMVYYLKDITRLTQLRGPIRAKINQSECCQFIASPIFCGLFFFDIVTA
jgi:hypothetical protein